jgi:hypothetical protein
VAQHTISQPAFDPHFSSASTSNKQEEKQMKLQVTKSWEVTEHTTTTVVIETQELVRYVAEKLGMSKEEEIWSDRIYVGDYENNDPLGDTITIEYMKARRISGWGPHEQKENNCS